MTHINNTLKILPPLSQLRQISEQPFMGVRTVRSDSRQDTSGSCLKSISKAHLRPQRQAGREGVACLQGCRGKNYSGKLSRGRTQTVVKIKNVVSTFVLEITISIFYITYEFNFTGYFPFQLQPLSGGLLHTVFCAGRTWVLSATF